MIVIKIVIIIIGTKIDFGKSSPYYNPYKSSGKNKVKHYFRHSIQHSVPWRHSLQSISPIVFSLQRV